MPVSCSLSVEALRLNIITKRGKFIHAVVEGTDFGEISNEGGNLEALVLWCSRVIVSSF